MGGSGKAEAALALHRFGMGPRPGSIAAIESDPRGALIAELEKPPAGVADTSALPPSARAYRIVAEANARRQAKTIVATRDAKKQPMSDAAGMMAEGDAEDAKAKAAKAANDAVPDPGRKFYLEEARIRIEAALGAQIGFVERLVW